MISNEQYWLHYKELSRWLQLFEQLPSKFKDVYFHPHYLNLYSNELSEPAAFFYQEENEIFYYPFLLQKILQTSSPLMFDITTPYGYGGPVYTSEDNNFLRRALEAFERHAKEKNIIAEVIRFHPLINNERALNGLYPGKLIEVCPTIYVDLNLEDEDRWSNIYSHANRKNINKALKNSLRTEFSQQDSMWEEFISLYEKTMEYNKATSFYYFEDSYFNKIKNDLSDNYTLVTTKKDEKVIAALLVLFSDEFAHCHLIGSDREFLNLGTNNLLHHELIKWCNGRKIKLLHIGGGRTNTLEDSLLKFKMNFSDKLTQFFIGERIFNQEIHHTLCQNWEKNNPEKIEHFGGRLLRYRI